MDISGTTAIIALNTDWLASGANTVTVGEATTGNVSYQTLQCSPSIWREYYPYPYWSYPVYVSSPSRPIKLTLREVERLRDAAHRDRDLRAILERFTPLIEVSVTFEER